MLISNDDWLTWYQQLEQVMNSEIPVITKYVEVFRSGISEEMSQHYLWNWVNLKISPEQDLNSFWQAAQSVKRQIDSTIIEEQLAA